jgi:putative ABC transport system ATP-binding protein
MSAQVCGEYPVRLVRVSKRFADGRAGTAALQDISFAAEAGSLHLFLGPSGSGKTTLLTLMAGLQRPTSGEVILFGREVESYGARALQTLRARALGFMFQEFHLIDSLSVQQNVSLVLRFAGSTRLESRRRVLSLLNQLGIAHLKDRFPVHLSQGEKQRVALARALANHAALVIADEPTASLESTQGLEAIQLLGDYAHREGHCVIVASHDLRLARHADSVHHLDDGILRPWADRGVECAAPMGQPADSAIVRAAMRCPPNPGIAP